jgi:cytochrome c oxidase subunit 4
MTDATAEPSQPSAIDTEDDPANEAVHHMFDKFEHSAEYEPHGEHSHGLSDLGYVKVAIFLAVVTGIEVALSYMVDDLGAFFLPALLFLMALKFVMVVLYFMHLKFDNRLFSVMFYLGLGLAIGVYVAALFTFKFFSI